MDQRLQRTLPLMTPMLRTTSAILAALLSLAVTRIGRAELAVMLTVGGVDEGEEGSRIDEDAFLLNADDWEEDILVEFHLTGLPQDKEWIDFWRGEDCNEAANRTESGGSTPCHLLSGVGVSLSSTSQDIDVRISELFESDTSDGESVTGVQNIYVLAVESANSMSETTAFVGVKFNLDRDIPAAPDGLETEPGDSDISVTWNNNDEGDLDGYRIYVKETDSSNCVDDQTELVAGGAAPSRNADATSEAGQSEASLDGEKLELELNGWAAVSITAFDKAGNESPLSDIGCVQRIPTVGFCEQLENMGGETRCEDCSVSHVGPGKPVGLSAWILGALGGVLSMRRRRR